MGSHSGFCFHWNTQTNSNTYVRNIITRSSGFRIVCWSAAFPPRYALGVTGKFPVPTSIPDYSGGTATDLHRVPG